MSKGTWGSRAVQGVNFSDEEQILNAKHAHEIWMMYGSEIGVSLTKKKNLSLAFCIRAHLWLKTALHKSSLQRLNCFGVELELFLSH